MGSQFPLRHLRCSNICLFPAKYSGVNVFTGDSTECPNLAAIGLVSMRRKITDEVIH